VPFPTVAASGQVKPEACATWGSRRATEDRFSCERSATLLYACALATPGKVCQKC